MDDIVTIYTLADSEDVAVHLATTLVREKLIACANIMPQVESVFMWDDHIDWKDEVVIIAKTKLELFPKVKEKVCELHHYHTPCVISLPLSDGNPSFLNWVSENTLPPNEETST